MLDDYHGSYSTYKGQIAPRSFRKQRIINPKMSKTHFLVAITVVACWVIPATAQDPPPTGNCGKYFPYYTTMTCWEMGGKCYCTGLCENGFGCSGMASFWESAYKTCLEQNMTLLTIETQEEDKMIDDFFQLNHEFNYNILWTSGKYSELSNQWEWTHYGNETTTVAPATPPPGTPMGYTNWYPGRPNNNKDGRCLGLVFNYGVTYENGHWDEFSCQDGYYGVFCEEPQ